VSSSTRAEVAADGRRGVFITLEGVEGAGKTTQARRLVAVLEARGFPVLYSREPGGTAIGERIRELLLDDRHGEMVPEAEMLLFAASRAQFVREVVLPALAAGRVVVSERYVEASLAYQGYGRGLDVGVVRAVNAVATAGCVPDLTLLLDLPPEVGLTRARHAPGKAGPPGRGDRLEQETEAFHRRVREGFLALAAESPQHIVVVDASRSADEVHAAILAAVDRLLAARYLRPPEPRREAGPPEPRGG